MTSPRRPSAQTTAVVLALAEQPATWRYGYALCQQLDLKAGSVYPILMRLADRGLLETTWERDLPAGRPPRQLYRLTGPGRVLAEELAGCVWLAVAPPRWLLPDRHARRFGVAMAIALVAGFMLVSRLEQRDLTLDAGIMSYLLLASPAVVLTGSVAAAAVGRSFRSGLWACAWAIVLGAPLLIGVAGRGAALVPARSRAAPGRGRGLGWVPTWGMRSGGPWCSWCCGRCPSG